MAENLTKTGLLKGETTVSKSSRISPVFLYLSCIYTFCHSLTNTYTYIHAHPHIHTYTHTSTFPSHTQTHTPTQTSTFPLHTSTSPTHIHIPHIHIHTHTKRSQFSMSIACIARHPHSAVVSTPLHAQDETARMPLRVGGPRLRPPAPSILSLFPGVGDRHADDHELGAMALYWL